jgi:hypothetical protein
VGARIASATAGDRSRPGKKSVCSAIATSTAAALVTTVADSPSARRTSTGSASRYASRFDQ